MPANYVLLEKITVGAAGAANVTFSNIPQTGYTDLLVKASMRSDRASQPTADTIIYFNGDTGGNYTTRRLEGNGSTAYSQTDSGAFLGGQIPGSTATSSTFANCEFYIPNYTGASLKSASLDDVGENNGIAYMDLHAGLWNNTAAITSITYRVSPGNGNFVQGSTFYLYGVAKLGTTPAIVPYATGGDTIMTDGTYWYHAFRSSGTFTPAKGLSCDVLVVAGGGGGSSAAGALTGAGGGAGGVAYQASRSAASGIGYTVTIGAGGGTSTGGGAGNQGSNSVFDTITANGGGGAGAGYSSSANGLAGGSGGGGGGIPAGGTASGGASNQGSSGGATGYGNAGGSGQHNPGVNVAGGGGGGAGAAGGNAVGATGVAGSGGSGLNTWSTWATATSTGVSGYYAGGGGGGGGNGVGGAGGAGGGATGLFGGNGGTPTAAIANTGGGGGGAPVTGGAGGSGLVIVRYAV
jgi:hypothetical protein